MEVVDLPIGAISTPEWNPNEMDQVMRTRLRRSIERFGCQVPLLVRPVGPDRYETIGGAQRLAVLGELGAATAPCVLVQVDDAEAKLLSQALNHIAGEDNPGLRAELLRHLLDALPQEDVLTILPDSAKNLQALASMGQESMAEHLQSWQQAQQARLHHLTLQLQPDELNLVEEALSRAIAQLRGHQNGPNLRGQAFTAICQFYLEHGGIV